MKWSEILEHCATEYLDDRTSMLEGAADNQFSDASLLRHLAEAQRKLARKIWCIQEDETAVEDRTSIALEDGVATYTLDPSVLFVKFVRLSDSEQYLSRVGRKDVIPGYILDDTYIQYVSPNAYPGGRPMRFETQSNGRVLRLDPKPDFSKIDDDLTLELSIIRLPVLPVTTDTLESEPEVPAEYHFDLALYAAGMALTTSPSVDTAGRTAGKNMLAMWGNVLGEGKRDELRRKSQPAGFIFGGWASDDGC